MRAILFGVPGSHPSLATALMLDHKGIDHRRVDLVPGVHKALLRGLGFRSGTVPALRLDGQRLQGSRTISRALHALRPDPTLFPREPERRAEVERAELWGDEVLQALPRRLSWAALKRDRSTIGTLMEDARLGIPTSVAAATSGPIVALCRRLNKASDENVRRDLQALPGVLDRVDAWVGDGLLGSAERNAADFQIATSVRLLLCFDDLREPIEERPAAAFAREVVPRFPGRIPPAFPAEWLLPMRSAPAAAAAA